MTEASVDGVRSAWAAAPLTPPSTAGAGIRLLRPAAVLLLVAASAQSLLHVVDVAFFELSIDRFNADHDGSIAGWLGTTTTALAAWGALLLALLLPAVRRPAGALAMLCGFLSLDDMLALHEVVARIALRLPLYDHSGYNLWVAVYLPLLCYLGWLLLRTARSVDPTTGRVIAAGLFCLAVAVVLESSAPALFALGSDHGQPLYESEVVIEEFLETSGWGLIALGLSAVVLDLLLARTPELVRPADALVSAPGHVLPAQESPVQSGVSRASAPTSG
jgi:hypothetical protein